MNMVFEKVRAIICDQLELDEDVVTLDSVLLEDLGADSIDLADLVMTLEDEFDMEISDEELENIRTVADIVKFIEEN
ncbi:MAG: acyl carrier protein [Clostridia bacterium]|nr:acyl carrier protein [Clostridia bacterium]